MTQYRKPQARAWIELQGKRIGDALEERFVAYLHDIEHRPQRELLADRKAQRLVGSDGLMWKLMTGAAFVYVVNGQQEANEWLDAALMVVRASMKWRTA